MTTNSSGNFSAVAITEEPTLISPFKFYIYIVVGSTLSVTNLLIFALVARYKCLRSQKGYVIVAGLAFVDGMAGVAQLIAGIWRLTLIYTVRRRIVNM